MVAVYSKSVILYNNPNNNIDIIGPIEHIATIPKLSLSESLSSLNDDIPIPKAIIKGTAIGPVVAPPESKAIPKNSSGTFKASKKAIVYKKHNIYFNFNFNLIRKKEIAKKIPTPNSNNCYY